MKCEIQIDDGACLGLKKTLILRSLPVHWFLVLILVTMGAVHKTFLVASTDFRTSKVHDSVIPGGSHNFDGYTDTTDEGVLAQNAVNGEIKKANEINYLSLNTEIKTQMKVQRSPKPLINESMVESNLLKNQSNIEDQEGCPYIGKISHGNSDSDISRDGEAYGHRWVAMHGGSVLTTIKMIALHLFDKEEHNTSLHGYPDIASEVVLPNINQRDKIEYWGENGLTKTLVDGEIIITNAFGDRTIWGSVPCFATNEILISGSPIFKNGQLISVITKSDVLGHYAVSGPGSHSGHVVGERLRVRKAQPGTSVYGSFIGDYDSVKKEALREKTNKRGPVHTEVVVLTDRIDVVQWRGDNYEILHSRSQSKAPYVY